MQVLDKLLSSNLECYRVKVRFSPMEDVCLDAWIGAVFRNRFLYFAESVCDDAGVSLRMRLDELPLSPEHAYYKQMKGGFPKGVLFDFRDIPKKSRSGTLYQDTLYSFQVVLIGTAVRHFPLVVESLCKMCAAGVGHPLVPLSIIDMAEQAADDTNYLLYSGNSTFLNMPEHGIRISDFRVNIDERCGVLFTFHTPLSLYQLKGKAEPELSYQHKMNGFPSFYQLVRSMVYRWATLSMLYGTDFLDVDKREFEKELDRFVESSSLAFLQEVTLRRRKTFGTPKSGERYVYVMDGYEGEVVFQNVSCLYLPLLLWGMYVSVGNNVQYGLGSYSVELV